MGRGNDGPLTRAKRQFIADYTADPWLKYILALTLLLTGFWFWHRIPNFATRDERWRLVDPMMAIGALVDDPSLSSLQQGIVRGRAYGATFYLYGIVLIPVFVVAAVTGQLGAFTIPQWHGAFDLWYQWNQTPRWIWTWSLLLARFVNVLLAVGCVYLTYRIGVMMRDRPTGRLAAVLLTLTFGFFMLAHEAGEDIPALFCLLLTIYFAFRYIETGDETTFLIGCIVGGIAIALKLTTGVSVVLLGTTFLLRARNEDTDCPVSTI